jgi:hypothetical protein
MTYEAPEIRDFGDIADHTYFQGDDDFIGYSAEPCVDAQF